MRYRHTGGVHRLWWVAAGLVVLAVAAVALYLGFGTDLRF
jgi:hypothetical protein